MFSGRRSGVAKRSLRVGVVGATLALVAACAGEGSATDGGGDTLTMATYSASQSLDPTQVAGTGNSGGAELAALYDTVVRYDWETDTFEPQTAESLTPNEDFTEWTLKLKPDIEFSDGTPYNAEAVVANMQRHVEERSNTSSLVAPVESYDTPDDLTVVFSLAFPWNRFPYALASPPGMVVSPKAVAEQGEDLGTNPVGAGAGPFIFDSFRAGESVTLKRNPDYWGGEVPLESLEFVHLGDGAKTYEGFRAGNVDVAFLRDPGAIADAEADEAAGEKVHYSSNATMVMNNGLPIVCQGGEPSPRCDDQEDGIVLESESPTADKRVRQAVAAAIDLDTLNQWVYDGKGVMSSALIAESSRWYSGVEGPQYDIDRARDLVDEVKSEGWDGHIRVGCHTGNPDWGPAIQSMLEAAGFETTLEDKREIAANTASVVVRKDFDLACFGSSISDPEPFFALNRDFNSAFVETGGGNFHGYVNPAADEAIAKGRAAATDEEMQEQITALAELHAEDVPFLSLSADPEFLVMADNLTGVDVSVNSVMYFGKAQFE